jgi:transposase
MGRRGYPPEFRRRALDLLAAGRKVVDLARDLGVSGQTIYTWRRQDAIDRGLIPGLTSTERQELAAAKQRIRELEAELEIHRRASALLAEHSDPKGGSRRSR